MKIDTTENNLEHLIEMYGSNPLYPNFFKHAGEEKYSSRDFDRLPTPFKLKDTIQEGPKIDLERAHPYITN